MKSLSYAAAAAVVVVGSPYLSYFLFNPTLDCTICTFLFFFLYLVLTRSLYCFYRTSCSFIFVFTTITTTTTTTHQLFMFYVRRFHQPTCSVTIAFLYAFLLIYLVLFVFFRFFLFYCTASSFCCF